MLPMLGVNPRMHQRAIGRRMDRILQFFLLMIMRMVVVSSSSSSSSSVGDVVGTRRTTNTATLRSSSSSFRYRTTVQTTKTTTTTSTRNLELYHDRILDAGENPNEDHGQQQEGSHSNEGGVEGEGGEDDGGKNNTNAPTSVDDNFLDDVVVDDAMDCSRFENYDEAPSYCHDGGDNSGAAGAPTRQPGTIPEDSDTNTIQLSLSVGIFSVRLEEEKESNENEDEIKRFQRLTSFVIQVVETLLDRYTPYDVQRSSGTTTDTDTTTTTTSQDEIDFPIEFVPIPSNDRNRRHRSLSLEDHVPTEQTMKGGFENHIQQQGQQQIGSLAIAKLGNDGSSINNDNNKNFDTKNHEYSQTKDTRRLEVSEEKAHVSLDISKAGLYEMTDPNHWFRLVIHYTVVWSNGNPVMDEEALAMVESSCTEVINTTIHHGKFAEEMYKQDPNGIWILKDDKAWNPKYTVGIINVSKIGEEYIFDPFTRDHIFDHNMKIRSIEYSIPLDTTWTMREWIGLGICTVTTMMAVTLAVLATYLQGLHHDEDRIQWGLTEDGVDEFLKYGWAYQRKEEGTGTNEGGQQQQQQQQNDDHGQLFLKVYNKRRIGYSDENSILDGQQIFEEDEHNQTSAVIIVDGTVTKTATATTATPYPKTIKEKKGNGRRTRTIPSIPI